MASDAGCWTDVRQRLNSIRLGHALISLFTDNTGFVTSFFILREMVIKAVIGTYCLSLFLQQLPFFRQHDGYGPSAVKM